MSDSVWGLSDQEMQELDLEDLGMRILYGMPPYPKTQSVYNLRLNVEGVGRPDATTEGARAFAEALAWLQTEGLIAPSWDPGVPSSEWVFVTRKGTKRLSECRLGSEER